MNKSFPCLGLIYRYLQVPETSVTPCVHLPVASLSAEEPLFRIVQVLDLLCLSVQEAVLSDCTWRIWYGCWLVEWIGSRINGLGNRDQLRA